MIKFSKLLKILIALIAVSMLGYLLALFPDATNRNMFRIRTFISVCAVFLAIWVINETSKTKSLRMETKFLRRYLYGYVPAICISVIYSYLKYNYTIKQMLFISFQYTYILLAFPIIYIFHQEKGFEKFMNMISILVLSILVVKTFCFIAYNYFGIAAFPGLLFQYEGWQRDGMQRIDTGYLFGITFSYMLYKAKVGKNRVLYLAVVLAMMAFVLFVTKFRFQVITVCLVAGIVFFASGAIDKQRLLKGAIVLVAAAVFVKIGGLSKLVSSFSVTGEYGASTSARLITLYYYWQLIVTQRAFLGLGIFDMSNNFVASIVNTSFAYSSVRTLWLEDIGIIGGVFRFGVLSNFLYVFPFYKIIKQVISLSFGKKMNRQSPEALFLIGVSSYMVISCIGLNIYDSQRVFDVPFYFAIISYLSAKQVDK